MSDMKSLKKAIRRDGMNNITEQYLDFLKEGEHWDKVRGTNDTKVQQAQAYAQQMLDQHGDDENVQKLCAPILKLDPSSKDHQDQILDAWEQLQDYAGDQVGHTMKADMEKPKAEKKK